MRPPRAVAVRAAPAAARLSAAPRRAAPCPAVPGAQADEIYKITSVLGTPTAATWPQGLQLARAMNFKWPQFAPTPLSVLIPNGSPEALQLMTDMLKYDPAKRPTAMQALQYPFFQASRRPQRRAPARPCAPGSPLSPCAAPRPP